MPRSNFPAPDTNSQNLSAPNTVETMHEYTIDWTPDTITWYIDGTEMRQIKKSDTWNATANRFDYPQTPSRIMLSLWPAGIESNGKGTIEWAGGLIDWNSPYMQNGYYYANVKEVNVECYDPPEGANVQGSKSYRITGPSGTNDTVVMSDDVVVLNSLFATGEDPGHDPEGEEEDQVESVPGMSGGGNRGDDDVNSIPPGQATDGGSTPTDGGPFPSATDETAFNQGGGNNPSGARGTMQGAVGGSLFAVVMAIFGLILL